MRDYRLYQLYTREFGLTFLPKGMDDCTWEIVTELMIRALHREGPIVTPELIDAQNPKRSATDTDTPEAAA